jgi:hypothetical protein
MRSISQIQGKIDIKKHQLELKLELRLPYSQCYKVRRSLS